MEEYNPLLLTTFEGTYFSVHMDQWILWGYLGIWNINNSFNWFYCFGSLAFQNSKPDSLLKMEEEHKSEKTPLSGNKDNKFTFSFSNKKLLG